MEDAWHRHWATSLYSPLISGFLVGAIACAAPLLTTPGTRWLGTGLVLAILSPVVAGALPGGPSGARDAVALAVGFVVLAWCVVIHGRAARQALERA